MIQEKSLRVKIFLVSIVGVSWIIISSVVSSLTQIPEIKLLGIVGFLILFYAVYLEFVEGKKKNDN
jgi:hypothetical protein